MYTITTRALWDQYIKEEDTECVAVKGFSGLCKPVCARVQGIVLSICYYLTVVGYSLIFASTSSNFPEWRIDAVACHTTIPSLHCACDLCTVHMQCAYSVHVIPSAHRSIVRHHCLSPEETLLPPFSWVRLILVRYIEHQGNISKKKKARSNWSIAKLRRVSSNTKTRSVIVLWQEQVVLHRVILCYSYCCKTNR